MALIETVDLFQTYEKRNILKGINLKVENTEVFTLIGPTGAGKTTLIRILDLLEFPYSGKLFFDGVDVTSRRADRLEVRRRMSYVQQRPLVFTMNVYDNVTCALKWRHLKTAAVKRKADEALELVGMTDYRDRNAKTLSGGETQRVAIARALITEPEILFLDEPTANMDPVSTVKIEEVLSHIINKRKTTIFMTTHNMSQGQRLASRLGVLINGELLQTGSYNDIFNQPQNREVAEFVGVENILKGVVEENNNGLTRIAINSEKVSAVSDFEVGDAVYVLIKPEIIVFSLSGDAGSARNVFKGKINKINTLGSLVRIEVNCGFPLLGVVTPQSAQELSISVGKEMYVSFKATAVHVVKRYS